jgi:hypothetical protein
MPVAINRIIRIDQIERAAFVGCQQPARLLAVNVVAPFRLNPFAHWNPVRPAVGEYAPAMHSDNRRDLSSRLLMSMIPCADRVISTNIAAALTGGSPHDRYH